MPFQKEKRTILAALVIALLIGAAALSILLAERHAVSQAAQRARLMIMEIVAVQRYFQENIHTRYARLIEQGELPAGFFQTELLSFLEALETMIGYYNQELTANNLPPVVFGMVCSQPADHCRYEGNEFERDLIRHFQTDATLPSYHAIRRHQGQRVYYYAIPFAPFESASPFAGQLQQQREPGLPLSHGQDNNRPTRTETVAGLYILQIPIESGFQLSSAILWCSAAAALIIVILLLINRRLDVRIKISMDELQRQRLELDMASKLAHLGTWTINLDTLVFDISPPAAALLGDPAFSTGSPTVESMSHFLHPQDLDETLATVQSIRDGRRDTAQFVYRFRTPDRGYRTFSLSSRVFVDKTGTRHLVGNLIDITEQVQIRKERDNLLESLSERNQELEQYAYSVSHDLKTPLITIEGFTGLLGKALENGNREEARNALARISNSSRRLNELIENLLTLSRLGQVAHCTETVDLNAVVREALDLNEGQIRKRAVRLTVATLPEVTGDRLRLLQVFHNLIDNAVKFSYAQPDPKIDIGTEQRNGETLLFVRDNGIGVDPRQSREVFGLFRQLDRNREGSGFGLTLVKRIVEAHRGRIWLESPGLGLGATFYLHLPRREPAGPIGSPLP